MEQHVTKFAIARKESAVKAIHIKIKKHLIYEVPFVIYPEINYLL